MSTPDEHIHPHATGAAAETVKRHDKPEELIFYCALACC